MNKDYTWNTFFLHDIGLVYITYKFLFEEYNNTQSIFSVTTIMVGLQKNV